MTFFSRFTLHVSWLFTDYCLLAAGRGPQRFRVADDDLPLFQRNPLLFAEIAQAFIGALPRCANESCQVCLREGDVEMNAFVGGTAVTLRQFH